MECLKGRETEVDRWKDGETHWNKQAIGLQEEKKKKKKKKKKRKKKKKKTYDSLEVSLQKNNNSLTTPMQCHKTLKVTQNYVYNLVYRINDEQNATKKSLLSCCKALSVYNTKPLMWTLLVLW